MDDWTGSKGTEETGIGVEEGLDYSKLIITLPNKSGKEFSATKEYKKSV